MTSIDKRIAELGITIPNAPPPFTNYVSYKKAGNLIFVSGQIPGDTPEDFITGAITEKGDVEGTIDLERAKEAARICVINFIAQLKDATDGDLDRISKIVKITVFMNSHPSFLLGPYVANAASEILVAVFGEAIGKHARSAIGVAQLSFGVSVEIEGVAQILPPK